LALADSRSKDDQALAKRIATFVEDMPIMRRTVAVQRDRERRAGRADARTGA
jgi:hypothetical protein